MKVKDLNNSSKKTKKLIKATFIEMLAEKGEISKISVKELAERGEISRATFHAHYDDIFDVANDFENDLIEQFFTNNKLSKATDYDRFIDDFFAYLKKNDTIYKSLCRSNDFIFTARRLSVLIINKMTELFNNDKTIVHRDNLPLALNICVEGLFVEYMKYCRGTSAYTPDDLYAITKAWRRSLKETAAELGTATEETDRAL